MSSLPAAERVPANSPTATAASTNSGGEATVVALPGPEDAADVDCSKDQPYAHDREPVTQARAADWWPFRPLLTGHAPAGTAARWYSYTQTGGTRGDPRTPREDAGLSLVFETPKGPTARCGVFHALAAGAALLIVAHYASRDEIPAQLMTPGDPQEVRGYEGTHKEANEGNTDPQDDERLLTWVTPSRTDDGVLWWGMSANPRSYSRARLVALANGLSELT
jgi:hypothetical protein